MPSVMSRMPRKRKPKPSTAWPMLLTRPRRPKKDSANPTASSTKASSADVEGEELDGEGGADVRAEDDAERLAEGHEPGGDEADEHQRRCRRGLDEGGHQGARRYRGQPGSRHAGEEVAEVAARRTLQALAGQLHPIEQDREAAEQREEAHRRGLMARAHGNPPGGTATPARCAVSFMVSTRGGATSLSEQFDRVSRHREDSGRARQWREIGADHAAVADDEHVVAVGMRALDLRHRPQHPRLHRRGAARRPAACPRRGPAPSTRRDRRAAPVPPRPCSPPTRRARARGDPPRSGAGAFTAAAAISAVWRARWSGLE